MFVLDLHKCNMQIQSSYMEVTFQNIQGFEVSVIN